MEQRVLGKTGEKIPAIGLGTWNMGGAMRPDSSEDEKAIRALMRGLDLGMTLIDTAEMYGAGHSEEVVSSALKRWNKPLFLASKVSPSHFAYEDVLRSARKSLERLKSKQMDLYQLHWPNSSIPIGETMRAMEKLVKDGLTRYIGVSNFSVSEMRDAQNSLSREKIVSNQVEYSLVDRSIEDDVLPYCKEQGITVIAYSPLGQGRIPRGRGGNFKILDEVALARHASRSQVALSWVLRDDAVIAIPKAIGGGHVEENANALGLRLTKEDLERLDSAFPG